MKKNRLLTLMIAALLVALLAACGGGGDDATPEPVVEQPTEEPTEEPIVAAGGLDFTLDPTFGSGSLETGFVPDPFTVELVSGGDVDVDTLNLGPSCTGYALSAPDYRLNFTGESPFGLRIFFVATSGEDATLIVNDPQGNWHCNDDFNDLNPLIELDTPPEGQYDIWVGSYSAEDFIEGTLYITELGLDPASVEENTGGTVDAGALDFTQPATFGEEEIAAGFLPDPFTVDIVSGGAVNVNNLDMGMCRGHAAVAPDFRFFWSGDAATLRIFFVPEDEGEDTTLIINTPSADWACNDDYAMFDPLVEFENPAAGQYDVWVGSYMQDELIAGTLYITELDYDPDNLP
ncbi:MAG: hypothetical protein JXD18_10390 [Anaerolineae bacterium]|nr:hypothetical protein [Anaerolineae bacterium]